MAGYSTVTRFRRGLFWITVTLFFTTWPLLLMHTFGVEFDPDEERLVQRAAVWAVSRPSGATIFVDGREHDRPTPALVSGLEEGVHEIELRLEGHRPWRASLTTEENRVLELDAALLVPDEPVVESLSLTAPFVRLLVLGTHLVVVRETLADWSAHDIDAPGAVAARGPAERHDPDLVVERLDHPPYLDHALVLARDGDRRMPMLVSVRPGGIELDRLDVSLPDGARMVWHAPMIGSTLFQAHDRLLVYRSPLDDLSELEPSVAGSGYLDGSFYYVTRERIVRVTPL
ncbi:MAG: PEGA domain-containing protein, partial [Spirochaetota bacterium]